MNCTARLAGLAMILLASVPQAGASDAVAPPGSGTTADASAAAEAKPVPEARVWVTRHKARIGGAILAYTATAGTILMKNDKGEPIALFGFTAYTRDGADPATRPVVFAFNGGPGSASAWLHMGILGPRRTELADLESNTRGPFRTVDNEYSILDRADLVMLDPVGTGFSRPVGKGEGKDFWGVDQDIDSVTDFIVRYLGDYGRWASPKFVLGESYGGMRAAGVAYALLSEHNVSLNGLILVSPYLDLASGWAGLGADVGYVNFLPTYAATAWYHGALADRPAELQPFLREAETFAENEYARVLFKGSRATAAEREVVLDGLARYTGVSAAYWDKANLRLDEPRFLQELLRSRGAVVGRVDSRYVGGDISRIAEVMKYDPYGSAVGPAVVATFNDYYRRELEVDSDREYVLSGDLEKDWDNRHAQPDFGGYKVPYPNTIVDLSHTITVNPKMKVLIQQGYFDLACPYRTVTYAVDHLDVDPKLRGNVAIEYYDAGHMMYVHPASMQKFARTLAAFVDSNSR
jgi:carboxypeptidase C (cathepsin A)